MHYFLYVKRKVITTIIIIIIIIIIHNHYYRAFFFLPRSISLRFAHIRKYGLPLPKRMQNLKKRVLFQDKN